MGAHRSARTHSAVMDLGGNSFDAIESPITTALREEATQCWNECGKKHPWNDGSNNSHGSLVQFLEAWKGLNSNQPSSQRIKLLLKNLQNETRQFSGVHEFIDYYLKVQQSMPVDEAPVKAGPWGVAPASSLPAPVEETKPTHRRMPSSEQVFGQNGSACSPPASSPPPVSTRAPADDDMQDLAKDIQGSRGSRFDQPKKQRIDVNEEECCSLNTARGCVIS